MIVNIITVFVKNEHIENFIKASIENHQHSINEAGNLRFDILQCSTDLTRFTLYEAYDTEEAVIAHKNTSHYTKWRDLVAPWMKLPRESIAHSVIAPLDKTLWKR